MRLVRVSEGRLARFPRLSRNYRPAVEDLEDRLTPAAIPPPAGIIAWWPGDGNAIDIVGHHDGTLMGGATIAPGLVGQAFRLDGVNDFIQVPSDAALDPAHGLTIE